MDSGISALGTGKAESIISPLTILLPPHHIDLQLRAVPRSHMFINGYLSSPRPWPSISTSRIRPSRDPTATRRPSMADTHNAIIG